MTVLALSTALRTFDLAEESIWSDEALSIAMARLSPGELLSRSASHETANYTGAGQQRALVEIGKPPLYFLLMHFWIRAFGESAAAVRSLSVIFGAAAIFLVFSVARRFMSDYGAIAAAAFTALSRIQLHYSQEARPYALLTFCAVFSYVALLRFEERRTPASALLYVAAGTLTAYTHSVGVFVIGAQAAWVCLRAALWPDDRRLALRVLGLQAGMAVLCLIWMLAAVGQYRGLGGTFWVPRPTLYSVFQTLWDYVGSSLLLVHFAIFGGLGVLVLRPVHAGWARGPIAEALQRAEWNLRLAALAPTLLLVTWIVVPIGALFLVSLVGAPIYITRATIVASVGWFLLAARGVDQLPSPRLRALAVVVLCLLMTREATSYYRETTRQAWRPASAAIAAGLRPGDLVLFHPGGGQRAFEYYVRRQDIRRQGFPQRRLVSGESLITEDMATLPDHVRRAGRIWFVLVTSSDNGLLLKELTTTRDVAWHERFPGIRVYLLEPRPAPGRS